MKVLLRNFFPCPPVARWRKFEAMLKDCLTRLGHTISELEFDPSLPADPIGLISGLPAQIEAGNAFRRSLYKVHAGALYNRSERLGADPLQASISTGFELHRSR